MPVVPVAGINMGAAAARLSRLVLLTSLAAVGVLSEAARVVAQVAGAVFTRGTSTRINRVIMNPRLVLVTGAVPGPVALEAGPHHAPLALSPELLLVQHRVVRPGLLTAATESVTAEKLQRHVYKTVENQMAPRVHLPRSAKAGIVCTVIVEAHQHIAGTRIVTAEKAVHPAQQTVALALSLSAAMEYVKAGKPVRPVQRTANVCVQAVAPRLQPAVSDVPIVGALR